MRKRFEQQMELGVKLIEETPVRSKSRDDILKWSEKLGQQKVGNSIIIILVIAHWFFTGS